MIGIPELSAIVAATGVLIGFALTILQLRHLRKQRKTELVVRLYSVFISNDFLEAVLRVRNLDFEDYGDFAKKYGSLFSDTPTNVAILKIVNYFEQVGTLLHKGLIDADLAAESLATGAQDFWNKLKPIIEGLRKETGTEWFYWFEYFNSEMQKREQPK